MTEKYQLEREIFSFSKDVKFYEAVDEDTDVPVWVLHFSGGKDKNVSDVYKKVDYYTGQLRNRCHLLQRLDIYRIETGFRIVYERQDSFTSLVQTEYERGQYPLWIMREAADILCKLYTNGWKGHFFGERAIFVDEEKFKIRLGSIGLLDAFRVWHLHPWIKDQGHLNQQDDIYHLAQCFEENIKQSKEEVIHATLAEDREKRPDYPDLLRAMGKEEIFRPRYDDIAKLLFNKKMDKVESKELVKHLNLNDCYISPWRKLQKQGKEKRECNFETTEFKGTFVNTLGDEHYYVPKIDRRNSKWQLTGKIFRVRFEHVKSPIQGESGYHHLATLDEKKADKLQEWKTFPKNEKEFIEETAFQSKFCHVRRMKSSVRKLAFLLDEDEALDWQKLKQKLQSLKEKKKHLEAVWIQMARSKGGRKKDVGVFDDLNQGRLVIGVESDKNQIPGKGRLGIDGIEKHIPFDFYWRKGRCVYFVAPENFENAEKVHKILISNDARIIGHLGELGKIVESFIAPEIITRDDKDVDISDYFDGGNLSENISREIIPFKRQIDAVDAFEAEDMIEPSLGEILATPQTYKASRVPFVEFAPQLGQKHEYSKTKRLLFNQNLNDSQKKAVTGALFQKPLFLIQGPPGTGKTTVIIEIIRQVLRDNQRARILVCSQTNLAVDNVLERLPDGKKEREHDRIRKVRLASPESKLVEKVQKFWFDELLKSWKRDVINRGKKSMKGIITNDSWNRESVLGRELTRAFTKANNNDELKWGGEIKNILKKWHAFLNSPDPEIRSGNTEGREVSLEIALLKSRNVIGSTCVHIASRRYREIFRDTYDYLIIDEASKATPAEALIPILHAKQIVLIGDHKQLPPFVSGERELLDKVQGESPELEDMGHEDLRRKLGKSLFEELIPHFSEEESMQVMLNVQWRMHKQIGDLISKYFYDNKLQSPDDESFKEGLNNCHIS